MIMNESSVESVETISEMCLFRIDKLLCGLDIKKIVEISIKTHITPVHGASDYIKGVANLRGQIVTILDLRKKFNLPDMPDTVAPQILIINDGGEKNGLLVDEVESVIDTQADNFDFSVNCIKGIDNIYYKGIYKMDNEIVMLLSLEDILHKDVLKASKDY
jgi:purine-binding chemotaxis protein CheW